MSDVGGGRDAGAVPSAGGGPASAGARVPDGVPSERGGEVVFASPPEDLLTAAERGGRVVSGGDWRALLRGESLDDVHHAGRPLVRAVRLVLRDADWRTLPLEAESVSGSLDAPEGIVVRGIARDPLASAAAPGAAPSGAALSGTALSGTALSGTAPFGTAPFGTERLAAARLAVAPLASWTLTARADADGLVVRAEVRAERAFRRNRIGLVVLHPPALAGSPLVVEHPDGTRTSTVFPERIAPHQPARDVAALEWEAHAGRFRVELAGDVFEMEDQRNWTDASFKTYSTPLALPFPVDVEPGEVVVSEARLTCTLPLTPPPVTFVTRARASHRRVVTGATTGDRIPLVTTMASTAPEAARPAALDPRLARSPLVVEVDPATPRWTDAVERAGRESAGPIDVRIVATDADEAEAAVARVLSLAGVEVARVGVFSRATHASESDLLDGAGRALALAGRPIELLGGVRGHFTELNRTHERLSAWRGPLAFSITPTMHDLGGQQIAESLAMQRLVREDATRIADGRDLHVGPVTLRARFNAVATSRAARVARDPLAEGYGPHLDPLATDGRQAAASLGAWLVASASALARDPVRSACWFEQWGPRGLQVGEALTAAGVVFAWLLELAGHERLAVGGPDGAAGGADDAVAALAAASDAGPVVLLGNLGHETADVELVPPGRTPAPPALPTVESALGGVRDARADVHGAFFFALAPGEAVRVRLMRA